MYIKPIPARLSRRRVPNYLMEAQTMELQPACYATPRPLPELNGKEGLTSIEIALSLNAEHKHVRDNIRSLMERDAEFKLSVVRDNSGYDTGKRGPKQIVYVMPTEEAQLVVAKYDNDIGRSFLRHLLRFHSMGRELIPKMVDEIAHLRQRLAETVQPKRRRLADGRKMVLVPVYTLNLWNERTLSHKEWVLEEDAAPDVVLDGKIRHLHLVSLGAQSRAQELQNRRDGKNKGKKRVAHRIARRS